MRLLLITRQFWPSVGGAQIAMANLAESLCDLGANVTVLTARWHPTWPMRYQHGQVRVLRLPQPAIRMWGTFRYMKALRRWLRENESDYDLVYVSMLKHEAYVAIRQLADSPIPVVLRAEGAGPLGDVAWHEHARFGQSIRQICRQADALVAIAPPVREELLGAEFPTDRLVEIPNGVKIPKPVNDAARLLARQELAASDPRLRLPENARLAIYVGRLHEEKGLQDLIGAWRTIEAEVKDARLWIVGDGPQRRQLISRIDDFGLQDSVIVAGSYDSTTQFYQAADVFAFPSRCELMSLALLEAMAAGNRIVASDIAGNRHLLDDGQCGLLVPAGQPGDLAAALQRQLAGDPELEAMSAAARNRVQEHFSLAHMAREHWRLFERLLKQS